MAMDLTSGRQVRAAINMTPMIDVLLVLLIIFMAISPQTPEGLNAAVPGDAASPATAQPESTVVLEIAADGRYTLNTEPVDADNLAENLTRIYSRRASRVLFLKGAPDLEFSTVAAAIDTAHGASVTQIALMPR